MKVDQKPPSVSSGDSKSPPATAETGHSQGNQRGVCVVITKQPLSASTRQGLRRSLGIKA